MFDFGFRCWSSPRATTFLPRWPTADLDPSAARAQPFGRAQSDNTAAAGGGSGRLQPVPHPRETGPGSTNDPISHLLTECRRENRCRPVEPFAPACDHPMTICFPALWISGRNCHPAGSSTATAGGSDQSRVRSQRGGGGEIASRNTGGGDCRGTRAGRVQRGCPNADPTTDFPRTRRLPSLDAKPIARRDCLALVSRRHFQGRRRPDRPNSLRIIEQIRGAGLRCPRRECGTRRIPLPLSRR